MSANTNSWQHPHKDLWLMGPLSIVKQPDERTRTTVFELYDSTRFVDKFGDLAAAMQHARQRGWSVAV